MVRTRWSALFPTLLCGGLVAQSDLGIIPFQSDPQRLARSTPSERSGTSSTVADLVPKDPREAPGIVQVITAEEIRAAGCVTLEDALLLVPGFTLGRDVDDVLGFNIRGHWSHEGKCLYMLNGMPLNEASFGTFNVNRRIPLSNVARIEVINGPGSVLYGGMAAVGVVNIVTRTMEDEEALEVEVTQQQQRTGATLHAAGMHGQHRVSPTTELDYQAGMMRASRFAPMAGNVDGPALSLADSSRTRTMNGFFRIIHRNFTGQFLVNDHYTAVSDEAYDVLTRSVIFDGRQRFDLGPSSRMDLGAYYRYQLPWEYNGQVAPDLFATNTYDQRIGVNATLLKLFGEHITLTTGTQAYMDRFTHSSSHANATFRDGRKVARVLDAAVFGEAKARWNWGTFTLGARGEANSLADLAWAPRAALTLKRGRIHAKLLMSQAYKLPMFQNVETAQDERSIRTEHATTHEMELGLRIGRSTDVAGVVYRTTLSDPIVYALLGDSVDVQDSYLNRRSASTQGIELRATHRGSRRWVSASFSYYQALTPAGDLPETEVPEMPTAHLGSPCTKATLVLRQALGKRWWMSARAMHLGRMWTYQPIDSTGTLALTEYPEALQVGMRVEHALAAITGLSITLGVDNLLDRRWYAASPYNNGLYTLPMAGREVVFHVRYRFQL